MMKSSKPDQSVKAEKKFFARMMDDAFDEAACRFSSLNSIFDQRKKLN